MTAGSLVIRGARVVALGADASHVGRALGDHATPSDGHARHSHARRGHPPTPEPVDIAIRDGVIAALAPRLPDVGLPALDAGGAWAVPGLWDAHVHVDQWVRRSAWHDVAGSRDAAEVCARVRAVVEGRGSDDEAFLTFFGSRSVTWPRPGTVAELDAASGRHPVAVIAGDVHNGWLNSAALRILDVPPRTGPLVEAAWFDVFGRLSALPGGRPGVADEQRAIAAMAAQGLTGLVDLELSDAFRAWPRRIAAGIAALRVRAGCYPHQLDEVLALGLRSGDPLPGGGGLATMGPLKIISDGSMGTRTAWCHEPYADARSGGGSSGFDPSGGATAGGVSDVGAPHVTPDEVARLLERAHAAGLEVAVHAIGDRANEAALDAFEATGAGGSIEHAQLIGAADIVRFTRLGVRASMQPLHLIDDADTAERLWPGRTGRLFAFRSLLDAGADVRFGSDAPVSPVDPWGAMAAAVHRATDDRPAWHPEQALTPAEALACSVDGRRLVVGAPGDLVLLGRDPLRTGDTSAETAANLRGMPVLATICAGRVTFDASAGSRP